MNREELLRILEDKARFRFSYLDTCSDEKLLELYYEYLDSINGNVF